MPFTTIDQLKSYLDQGNHLTQEQLTQALRVLSGQAIRNNEIALDALKKAQGAWGRVGEIETKLKELEAKIGK